MENEKDNRPASNDPWANQNTGAGTAPATNNAWQNPSQGGFSNPWAEPAHPAPAPNYQNQLLPNLHPHPPSQPQQQFQPQPQPQPQFQPQAQAQAQSTQQNIPLTGGVDTPLGYVKVQGLNNPIPNGWRVLTYQEGQNLKSQLCTILS